MRSQPYSAWPARRCRACAAETLCGLAEHRAGGASAASRRVGHDEARSRAKRLAPAWATAAPASASRARKWPRRGVPIRRESAVAPRHEASSTRWPSAPRASVGVSRKVGRDREGGLLRQSSPRRCVRSAPLGLNAVRLAVVKSVARVPTPILVGVASDRSRQTVPGEAGGASAASGRTRECPAGLALAGERSIGLAEPPAPSWPGCSAPAAGDERRSAAPKRIASAAASTGGARAPGASRAARASQANRPADRGPDLRVLRGSES